MIPDIHKARWQAFLDQCPDKNATLDLAMWRAYRHGFTNPGQTYDEQQWAVMQIQMSIMDEAGWHGLDRRPRLKTVETVKVPKLVEPGDPDLFRF